jgi:hypothetical protein
MDGKRYSKQSLKQGVAMLTSDKADIFFLFLKITVALNS